MSAELIKARSKIAGITGQLKKGKLHQAVISLHDALAIILRTPLIKHEQDEFARNLEQTLFVLNKDAEFRKLCPVLLEYRKGGEKELLDTLKTVLADLQGSAVEEAQALLAANEKAKNDALSRGRELIGSGKFKDAKQVFDKALLQFGGDTGLKAEIADLFLAAERYETALEYLAQALADFPESVHLMNRIAMALRKMNRFEDAEQYYRKALEYAKDDPNLFFNMGRMYIDWKQWKKAAKVAELALRLKPDFDHARKMLTFAQKKMACPT